MEPKHISSKMLAVCSIAGSVIFIITFVYFLLKSSAKIIFCDVGEGDGAYIRTSDRKDIIIDAGPDARMSRCLSRFMPPFDRTIELAFISHPQIDHYGGIREIIKHYDINVLYTHPSYADSSDFTLLIHQLKQKGIQLKQGYTGDMIRLNKSTISVVWPSNTYIKANFHADPNTFSYVFLFKDKKISALFTGDITPDIFVSVPDADILKVPHHGSKNGLTSWFLKQVSPTISVISAGRKNKYGHPSNEILDLFSKMRKKVERTDLKGDIIIPF